LSNESPAPRFESIVDGNQPDDLHDLSGDHVSAEARAAYRATPPASQ
jgi:hypothetical protein